MAERLGNQAINHKLVGLSPGCAKLCSVLGQGTSPYLPRWECPCNYCKSLWIRMSAKCLNVNVFITGFVIKIKYSCPSELLDIGTETETNMLWKYTIDP